MICIVPRYSASLVIPRATRSPLATKTVQNYFKNTPGLCTRPRGISLVQSRCLSCSNVKYEKPSSKIEVTVQHLKQEKDDKIELPIDMSGPQPLPVVVVAKKSLKQRFIDECKHYYSGFKLLFLDVKVSSKIIWKILRGNGLSRRERKQLIRTTSDVFRLVPFSVFIIVPFMELLLPVALMLFPGMLPSTFITTSEREAKMKRTLQAKLEYAKFLQKTLDEMAPVDHHDRSSKSARDFVNFLNKIKSQGSGIVDTQEIIKFSKLFEDNITLDNMTRTQLIALCRLLELTPMGTTGFLKLQLEMRLRHLKTDDRVIQREGLENLTIQELQIACKERGMRALGLSADALCRQLQQWLDLSLNGQVPPSLLLLSRTMYLPDTLEPQAKIAATISALPDSAIAATSAQIGEREGKIRNVVRLEQIKEEQRKIDEEEAEKKKEKKESQEAAKIKLKLPPIDEIRELLHQTPIEKDFFDKAPILTKTGEPIQSKKFLDPADLEDLKAAIQNVAKTKTESREIESLKKELLDYEEDLKDLDHLKVSTKEASSLSQSKGAKRLYQKVNRMLKKFDILIESLEEKERQINLMRSSEGKTDEEISRYDENLVTVQELIDGVRKMQDNPDSTKMEQIAEVLSTMDVDEDGMLKVDYVQKILDLLEDGNVDLPQKQVKQIVDMLTKEEMLEMEQTIEQLLQKGDSKVLEINEKSISNRQ